MKRRTLGINVVALLMMLFGAAEIVTAFTHTFFGITTASTAAFTYAAVAIGASYAIAGLLVLLMSKWAAALAIAILGADVLGRIGLVATGLYPIESFKQTFAVVTGTGIAVIFAIYIGSKWRLFS